VAVAGVRTRPDADEPFAHDLTAPMNQKVLGWGGIGVAGLMVLSGLGDLAAGSSALAGLWAALLVWFWVCAIVAVSLPAILGGKRTSTGTEGAAALGRRSLLRGMAWLLGSLVAMGLEGALTLAQAAGGQLPAVVGVFLAWTSPTFGSAIACVGLLLAAGSVASPGPEKTDPTRLNRALRLTQATIVVASVGLCLSLVSFFLVALAAADCSLPDPSCAADRGALMVDLGMAPIATIAAIVFAVKARNLFLSVPQAEKAPG